MSISSNVRSTSRKYLIDNITANWKLRQDRRIYNYVAWLLLKAAGLKWKISKIIQWKCMLITVNHERSFFSFTGSKIAENWSETFKTLSKTRANLENSMKRFKKIICRVFEQLLCSPEWSTGLTKCLIDGFNAPQLEQQGTRTNFCNRYTEKHRECLLAQGKWLIMFFKCDSETKLVLKDSKFTTTKKARIVKFKLNNDYFFNITEFVFVK